MKKYVCIFIFFGTIPTWSVGGGEEERWWPLPVSEWEMSPFKATTDDESKKVNWKKSQVGLDKAKKMFQFSVCVAR